MPSLRRRRFLATTLSATVLAGSGCLGSSSGTPSYRSYGYGPKNRGSKSGVTGPAEQPSEVWQFEDAIPRQTPVVAEGKLFTATRRNNSAVVVALDTETGDELWAYDAGNEVGSGFTPVVTDGTVSFLDQAGTVHAVDTAEGNREWQRELPHKQGPRNAPIVIDDALVFGLGYLQLFNYYGLYALETDDGSTRWHREPGEDNEPWTPVYPAGENDTIYAGFLRGFGVSAVSTADGSVQWHEPLDSNAQYTGVAVTDDRLYCGSFQGLSVVSRDTREILWQSKGSTVYTPPAVSDGRAFVSTQTEDGMGIVALTEGGKTQWHHATDSVFSSPSPATVADGIVYYGASDGQIYALDAETGEKQWTFGSASNTFLKPFVVDGTVFCTSSDGLFALSDEL